MSIILSSVSSNLIKKSIPIYASISIKPNKKSPISLFGPKTCSLPSFRAAGLAHDPTYVPGNSPPEIPTAPPQQNPGLPPEMPQRPNVPDFDPIPPEKPADPGPEFPGPPDPIPPKPEAPQPPVSPPGQPEVVPPHGPDVVPPKPPEPGPPNPVQPDIPPPIMGSNGLAFY